MHKFTIFTIILSIMVLFVVADLVLNDYLSGEHATDVVAESPIAVVDDPTVIEDPELRGDEEEIPDEPTEVIEEEVPVVEDVLVASGLGGVVTQELVASLNLLEPRLETVEFDGLVYGFWERSDELDGFLILEHTVFDGPNFVATIYEIQGENEIQTFAAYEGFRQIALTSPLGNVNENNSYGDGSFYFNHSTKLNTSYLVTRKELGVYLFQYGHDVHQTFVRPLIEAL